MSEPTNPADERAQLSIEECEHGYLVNADAGNYMRHDRRMYAFSSLDETLAFIKKRLLAEREKKA